MLDELHHGIMCDVKTNRFFGSLLGLALGDAFGALFEGGILERAVWAFIGTRNGKRRWTDDTQMTCAIWGASRGFDGLPQVRLEQLEQCGCLKALARSLATAASNRPTSECT